MNIFTVAMVPESPQYVATGNHTQSLISAGFQDSFNEVLHLVINLKTPGRKALLIEIKTMILEQQERRGVYLNWIASYFCNKLSNKSEAEQPLFLCEMHYLLSIYCSSAW